jgi:hypothetical protein
MEAGYKRFEVFATVTSAFVAAGEEKIVPHFFH